MGRILVADDEEGMRAFLGESLETAGHDVTLAEDGTHALALARTGDFDVVVTDLRMPGIDGMTFVRTLRTEQPDVEAIILTAFGEVRTAVEAMKLGAFDYLEKPIAGPDAIRTRVKAALERRAQMLAGDGASIAPSAAPGHGASLAGMRSVVLALEKVAKTSATVLLQGESGTGKEVAARGIHAGSARSQGPFIAINCAVLSESLIESELFGHEKGAFTGAHTQRRGRVELADGGTFFLDEVAELHPSLQAKLLRVLEERTFERVGGAQPILVDVRWIAATHRDLRAMVREGKFREDLYHRLAVFPIHLLPLRERREDIVPIAETLLVRLVGPGAEAPKLDERVKRHLTAAAWPGNIRELRNALERALILADGKAIAIEHFSLDGGAAEGAPGARTESTLADLERVAIESALASVKGNRREAAERLGIGLRTLYEKLKRYGLR